MASVLRSNKGQGTPGGPYLSSPSLLPLDKVVQNKDNESHISPVFIYQTYLTHTETKYSVNYIFLKGQRI